MSLVKIANLQANSEFVNAYVGETCFKQIERNLNSKMGFKNQMMKSMLQFLENSKAIRKDVKSNIFELLSRDFKACLQKISDKGTMIESIDEYDEKREDEKETL